jgi:3-hydroxyacyl-CoA dehydrogenase/enoyl-CoA hydratase/3-hydroxybutyryl-CoA epimerase/enoyl-CoA isomerase
MTSSASTAQAGKSLFNGKAVRVTAHADGIRELRFDYEGESTNRFNTLTLAELKQAWDIIEADKEVTGVLCTTGKESFFVGADVTEFTDHFAKTDEEFQKWVWGTQELFSRIEDFRAPVISLVHGVALGGGCEFILASHYRIGSLTAKMGLPETKLGIFPGWGGTVRLSRLCGADTAIEWIASGNQWKADVALKVGALDGLVAPEKLWDAGLRTLAQCRDGKLDWKARTAQKKAPLKLNKIESAMVFDGSKAFVAGQAGPNYPAPVAAIEAMEKGARLTRDEALKIEMEYFTKICRTPAAEALVGVFLSDQYAKKVSKKLSAGALPVKSSAVLGAGIMGGGIAYQSASSKIPALMKDIREEALALGMKEAAKILDKRVEKGQMTTGQMAETLGRIRPTLSMEEIRNTDIVVEAIVENEKVKGQVLAETEALLRPDAILTSNTSTISITRLAKGLKRPENFAGMHFFNPVHRMPLVEIIRGEKTSDRAIATAVAYATAMGKTAIVVNDCPGFLVNRVLFPYFGGFNMLMRDGVSFERIDKVMEKYGWPMGPAYLLDVVGIDTAHHAQDVMAQGFPDRMKYDFKSVIDIQYEAKRFGQKNGKGFFTYSLDPKGRPKKEIDPSVADLLKAGVQRTVDITDEEIVDRMMLPMLFESSRCLEDKIVASPMELDLSLLYGLGYPPFRGGVMRQADRIGAKKLLELGAKYASLGKLYEPTAQIRRMAEDGTKFYPTSARKG